MSSASVRFDFNPHSRKGSDSYRSGKSEDCKNFNPHSRKGSDSFGNSLDGLFLISIHTPARGVTVFVISKHSLHA